MLHAKFRQRNKRNKESLKCMCANLFSHTSVCRISEHTSKPAALKIICGMGKKERTNV